MIRQVLADIRLLRRGVILAIYVVVALVGGLTTWITRRAAAHQFEIIKDGLVTSGLDPSAGACDVVHRNLDVAACLAQPLSAGIDPVFPQSLLGYVPFVNEAADETSPVGLLNFASRHAGSMVGIMAVILLVSLHVTSTWDTGVGRRLFPLIGWGRFLTQKLSSIVVIVLPVPLVLWLGALLAKPIPIGRPLVDGSASFGTGLRQVALAYIVLIIVGILTTAIAVITRSMVLAFITTAGVVALSFFGTLDPDLYGYSPAGWIAVLMGFPDSRYRQVVDYLWVPSVSGHSAFVAVIGLLAFAVVPLGAAALFLRSIRRLA